MHGICLLGSPVVALASEFALAASLTSVPDRGCSGASRNRCRWPREPVGPGFPAGRRRDRDGAAGPNPHSRRTANCPSRSKACPRSRRAARAGCSTSSPRPISPASGLVFFSFSEPGSGGAGTAVARAKLVRDGGSARWKTSRSSSRWRRRPMSRAISARGWSSRPTARFSSPPGIAATESARRTCRTTPGRSSASIRTARSQPTTPRPTARALAGNLVEGPPQCAGRDLGPGARRAADSRARRQGRRRGQPPGSRQELRLAGHQLRRQLFRQEDRRRHRGPGYEQPLFYWDPSIAPSGLASYQGDMFPEWKGDLIVGSLKFELVSRLDRDAAGKILAKSACSKASSGVSGTSTSRPTDRSGC